MEHLGFLPRLVAAASGAILSVGMVASVLLGRARPEPRSVQRSMVAGADHYDRLVLAQRPVMYLSMGHAGGGKVEPDLSGHGHTGRYMSGTPRSVALPNGDRAAAFDGQGEYLEVASAPDLSLPPGGTLTLECWMRPATRQFPLEEGSGYVYVLGKGQSGHQEYALRMYSQINQESPPRPGRVSGYVFNPDGGLGAGAYFQDPRVVGRWVLVDVVVSTVPSGTVAIYEDGARRDVQSLLRYAVLPRPGPAPLRVATRSLDSFFMGSIGKVAVFDRALSPSEMAATYEVMTATDSGT